LEGSGYQWLHKLLVAFNAGDLEAYEGLCATHAAELSAQPALVASAVKLREKITILCLMEIIFAYAPSASVKSIAPPAEVHWLPHPHLSVSST
jgi:26S proteasome regulatory subunit N9